jgi:hypothetical protein
MKAWSKLPWQAESQFSGVFWKAIRKVEAQGRGYWAIETPE